jgi:hypothetical protein
MRCAAASPGIRNQLRRAGEPRSLRRANRREWHAAIRRNGAGWHSRDGAGPGSTDLARRNCSLVSASCRLRTASHRPQTAGSVKSPAGDSRHRSAAHKPRITPGRQASPAACVFRRFQGQPLGQAPAAIPNQAPARAAAAERFCLPGTGVLLSCHRGSGSACAPAL